MSQVEARATLNLVGLSVGQVVMVDPERPYIRMLLENGHLVRTGRETPEPAAKPKPKRKR